MNDEHRAKISVAQKKRWVCERNKKGIVGQIRQLFGLGS